MPAVCWRCILPAGKGFLAARKTPLAPADPKLSACVYRVLRRDGNVRWGEILGLACFEGAGPDRQLVSFGGAIQDIAERKEREEREHLLMREINHSAKNMLSGGRDRSPDRDEKSRRAEPDRPECHGFCPSYKIHPNPRSLPSPTGSDRPACGGAILS
jgi:hypothetical protein